MIVMGLHVQTGEISESGSGRAPVLNLGRGEVIRRRVLAARAIDRITALLPYPAFNWSTPWVTPWIAGAVLAVGISAPGVSDADEASYPRLDIEVDVEIEFQGQVDSDEAETNELLTTTEPYLALHLFEGFSIESGLVIEPVGDLGPGEDRFFGETGLFAEQLYLKYDGGSYTAFGGKFNPTFGIAWDITPGIFGTEVAEEFYEQVERIGFGGSIVFGGKDGIGGDGFGTHVLTGQTFFADTSFLSQSAFVSRGDVDVEDGGPGNTEDLESFSLTLDGSDLPGVPFDLGYHLGILRNAEGVTETNAEWGFAAGVYASLEVAEEYKLEPIVEYVRFQNDDGLDRDQNIITVGAALLHGGFNYALAVTHVATSPDSPGVEDIDFTQFQATAGYSFDFGLDADIGYKFTNEQIDDEGVDAHFIGVLLHYVVDGSIQ